MATAANAANAAVPTRDALPEGDLLIDLNSGLTYTVDDDISPRKKLRIARGPSNTAIPLRPIDVCPDLCVSAKDLMTSNDTNYQNWTDHADFNPDDPGDLATIDFTAQTTIAASYGLMQLMYVTAIDGGWQTTDGRRNPSLLFDNPPELGNWRWKPGGRHALFLQVLPQQRGAARRLGN